MADYDKLTDNEFDSILYSFIPQPARYLLDIPGVYELVKEHYNDAVLTQWESIQERMVSDGKTDHQASEEAEEEAEGNNPEAQSDPS